MQEPEVPEEAVETELAGCEEGFARLNPVERAAKEGDVVLIDYEGRIDGEPFEGGTARDYLLELGEGRVLPELEQGGGGRRRHGEERQATVHFPDDYPTEEVAGKTAEFEIKVKEVREKELPDLDDDFAAEASEFDTLDELRDHISEQIRQVLDRQIAERFREDALDAAVAEAKVELPASVIDARAEEMWRRVERSLQPAGDGTRQLPAASGKDPRGDDRPGAPRRRAGAEARGRARGCRRSGGDRDQRGGRARGASDPAGPRGPRASRARRMPSRRSARAAGRSCFKEDLRMRRALELIAEQAKPIPVEQAQAREEIWTPEKEREEKGSLWTPGSD